MRAFQNWLKQWRSNQGKATYAPSGTHIITLVDKSHVLMYTMLQLLRSLTYFMKFAVSIASCVMQYMARTTHHVYLWIFTDALEFMLLFFPMFTDVLSNEGPTHWLHGICLDPSAPSTGLNWPLLVAERPYHALISNSSRVHLLNANIIWTICCKGKWSAFHVWHKQYFIMWSEGQV